MEWHSLMHQNEDRLRERAAVKASHTLGDDHPSVERGSRVQGASNVRSLTGNPEAVHKLSALTTLIEPPSTTDDGDTSVNIVFVHSLGSSTRRCWTNAGSGMFWPISLHNVNGLQNARIMTFDYDTFSFKSLSDLAEHLLYALSNHNRSCGPVSFILGRLLKWI
jgi:hypothetical protein